jgi:hypothetical protein
VPPGCSPNCNDGTPCGEDSDCGSTICTAGTCQAPACAPTCVSGSPCGTNADCASKNCHNGACQ